MSNNEKSFYLDLAKIRQECSVFIATPMYGGQNSGFYMKSIMDLKTLLDSNGIKNTFFSIFNESLITRARNYCADEFLRSGMTHMLFIDSDIEFSAMDILAFLQLMFDKDKDIIGGAYPKKSISWEKVKRAVDKGFADDNPFLLENYSGDFVFNPVGQKSFSIEEPVEVLEIGTGFMMIKRSVFETWEKERPQYLYKPDHARTKDFDGSRKIMAYFQDPIVNERHLSEDYFFCQESRNIGLKVWLCPWMQVHHVGNYKFVGNLPAVAATGSHPTVDLKQLKGHKQS